MGHGDRRKCKCCLKLFRPDPRNRRHQCYCSAPDCRAARKTASQARWRAKPENQSYFLRPRERCPGPGLAVAPSRVLAQGAPCRHCVTRCLNGATHWSSYRNSQFGAFSVTRCLAGATCCSDWLNRPFGGNAVTR
jgi:hypothetical protein